jgi:hypothetical protein
VVHWTPLLTCLGAGCSSLCGAAFFIIQGMPRAPLLVVMAAGGQVSGRHRSTRWRPRSGRPRDDLSRTDTAGTQRQDPNQVESLSRSERDRLGLDLGFGCGHRLSLALEISTRSPASPTNTDTNGAVLGECTELLTAPYLPPVHHLTYLQPAIHLTYLPPVDDLLPRELFFRIL